MQEVNKYGKACICAVQKARDAAWQLLIDQHVTEPPVNITRLCKELGIFCLTYEKGQALIHEMRLEKFTHQDGFSVVFGKRNFVFYNAQISPKERIRFTLAHELGHIVLGHHKQRGIFCRYKRATTNKWILSRCSRKETQANIFASRLLAPACVLHALQMNSAEEIATLCGLSLQAAQIRMKRLQVLEKRNKWGTSPLERKIVEQFTPFIAQQNFKKRFDNLEGK